MDLGGLDEVSLTLDDFGMFFFWMCAWTGFGPFMELFSCLQNHALNAPRLLAAGLYLRWAFRFLLSQLRSQNAASKQNAVEFGL